MGASEKLSVGLLFDDTLDSNDGVAQQVKRLGEWLKDHGHEVVYLSGQTKLREWHGSPVYSLSKNVKVRFNGNRIGIPLWSRRQKLKSVLDKHHFDVVHVMMPYSPMMAQRFIAMASDRKIPIVGSFHILPSGVVSRVGSRLLGLWQRRSTKKLKLVTAVSPAAGQFLSSCFGVKSETVPNMVELAKFYSSQKTEQVKRVVFLGRLVPRKGCRELINAFAVVVRDLPDAVLIVAGSGPQRPQLEKLAEKKGISKNVNFAGFINEQSKASLLASARVACFPSLYGESFGVVLVEAMASGSGVVLGGDNPGYRSVLADQPELLVKPTNTDEFAQRLRKLLEDDELANSLHEWQEVAVQQYDVNKVAPQILDVYRRAVAKP